MAVIMPQKNGRYFSVKYNTTIGAVQYRPAVCYRLSRDIQTEVEGMAQSEGKLATIYDGEVRFISGVAYPVKKTTVGEATVTQPAVLTSQEGSASSVSKPRKGRREFM